MEKISKVINLKEGNTTVGVDDITHGDNYKSYMEVKKAYKTESEEIQYVVKVIKDKSSKE